MATQPRGRGVGNVGQQSGEGVPAAGGEELPPQGFEEFDVQAGELPPEAEEELTEELLMGAAPMEMRVTAESLLAAKEQLEQQLFLNVTEQALAAESGTDAVGFENIVAVAIGEKMIDDQPTGEPAVIVGVLAKERHENILPEALVPPTINGVSTDVVAMGELLSVPHRGRYRPAPGGVSVGHFRITAGTLGCLVRRGPALYILSNNHVLANSNAARIGDPILQPGPADGGRAPRDVIARLSQFVAIRFGGPVNTVDCAIAQTSPSLVTTRSQCPGIGRISAMPAPAALNLLVKKCGRTTQFTAGRATGLNATVWVRYGAQRALFRNQIIFQSLTSAPFSQPGDSGSLIVTRTGNRPVGLLYAGSATHTIANPIRDVLAQLNVSIVP
ncbi:MAG: hypothetical protein HY332_00840 [Chloroflexi bacterium]|nr:hypothetical protein [Chloroflexota bacterium]